MKVTPTYDRQIQIFDPAEYEDAKIAIIGLGNIGSNTAIVLARLGLKKFILIDHDHVEAHNLSSQSFTVKDAGKSKAESLAKQLMAINPACVLDIRVAEYAGEVLDASVLVSAVDSMAIRQSICDAMTANGYAPYVIDGRAGGAQIEVHSQPASEWGSTLVEDADTDPCGARFVCYASTIIGGFIGNQVKRHLKGESVKSRVLFHADTYQILTV